MKRNVNARNAPPRAGAMLESLRGLGYTTAAALADIVDNSISAGATEVVVNFTWNGTSSYVAVLDNGRGMDDAELESAMRLGDRSPLVKRDQTDLGRFGMGLKTASFSQCRRLTVASVKNGATSCLRWDLDALAVYPDDGWLLFEGPSPGSETLLAPISRVQSGTLVLWETLDRIVTNGYVANDFNDLIDRVESHFAMVFHRLIQGPHARLKILLNGKQVMPWDPFMMGNAAKTWNSPIARNTMESGIVEVECHVLPHRDKLSPAEFDSGGGPEGWTAQQGIYIYRNERLLVAGGWLGLGQGRAWNREESYRLARIRLDIPNTADAEWKIDIRKSTARPPVSIRIWLTRLAEDTRERARKVFAYRGSPTPVLGCGSVEPAWRLERTRTGMKYKIDEKHPVVSAVLDGAEGLLPMVKAMLRVVEETVPVQRIWLDTVENKETPLTGFSGEPPEKVVTVLNTIYADMIGRRGMSSSNAKKMLAVTEPFQNYPGLIASLPDDEPATAGQ
ncbi:ATP-binding protein [Candidatus Methylospira mobilis]|uniref:ATP-binding protein n=1 Tax=Candidatus Methylospira mobilis TaxID=1808979 RepID=UPI0028E533B9|nr:ATP-binding protein [Candidatus Methylospira mobilis]WNV03459.1 ATP-binding protein [Candidatus Methylospira mobilis]